MGDITGMGKIAGDSISTAGNLATSYIAAKSNEKIAQKNIDFQRETNAQNVAIHNQDKAFEEQQAGLNRGFQSGMANKAMDFSARQAAINRDFQSAEADKARAWDAKMVGDSISRSAGAYERLGLNPAAMLNGNGAIGSSSFGSGDSAEGVSASGSMPSLPGAPNLRAPHIDSNPMMDLINGFVGLETATSAANLKRAQTDIQKKDLEYYDRTKLLELKQTRAEIRQKLSQSDLNDEERSKLEKEERLLDLQIEYKSYSLHNDKQLSDLEVKEKNERIKGLITDNAMKEIEQEWMPKLLSSKYNLTNAQAKAVIMSANAALKAASAAQENSMTNSLRLELDRQKYFEVYKENIEASTKNLQASAGELDTQSDLNDANTDYTKRRTEAIGQNQMIHIGDSLLKAYVSVMGGAANTIGAIVKLVK